MLQVGDIAPDFIADTEKGAIRLSDYRGKKVILYFYSKDMTAGCSKQAASFGEHYADFKKYNAEIIGVSKDTIASHIKFSAKYDLPFKLVSDPDLKVIQAYGVWKEKTMYGKKSMGVERTTFIIDEYGVIQKIYAKVKVDGHTDKILTELEQGI